MIETNLKNISLASKKIIAREFLLLIVVIVVVILAYFYIPFYNSSKHSEYVEKDTELSIKKTLVDSLDKYYNKHYYYRSSYDSITPRSLKLFHYLDYLKYSEAKNDYLFFMSEMADLNKRAKLHKTLFDNDIYDSTLSDFESQIFNNTQQDIFNYKQTHSPYDASIQKLTKDISQLYEERSKIVNESISDEPQIDESDPKGKKKTYSKQTKFLLKVLGISLILIYGLRYFYYGIKWSIKILKQQ